VYVSVITCCTGHATFYVQHIYMYLNHYAFSEIYPHVHNTGSPYLNTDLPLPIRQTNIAFEMLGLTPEALQGSLTDTYLHFLYHLLQ